MGIDLAAALAAAGTALGGRHLTRVGAPLQEGRRSTVVRARLDDGATVVVKAFDPRLDGPYWQREAAALWLVRGRGLPVPSVLGVVEDPPLVVTADLGTGPSVAVALLGRDPHRATRDVTAWAGTLGRVHAATLDCGPGFAAALRRFAPGRPVVVDRMPEFLADAADVLADALPRLGVRPRAAALDELRHAGALLGPGAALTPADACPDNNLAASEGLVLLDFEGADVRGLAWDVSYLDVPWPTCWCAWRLPDEVRAAARAAWLAEVAPFMSYVDSAGFREDVAIASVAWAFMSASLFLPRALAGDAGEPLNPARPAPSRRAAIQYRFGRLATAAPRSAVPDLVELAAQVHAASLRAWGEVPLAVAPAYR